MNSEWMLLVSYIEAETSSIFFQELAELSRYEGANLFLDIEPGYEIELSLDEWNEFAESPTPLPLCEGQEVSSIRLRRVPRNYQKRDIPAGGELFSLLYRDKGFAAFSMREGDDEELILDGQAFGKFVDSGAIHKREVDLQIDGAPIRYLLFYSTGQAWRADVYEQLRRHLVEASWTKYLEDIESIILGYCEPEE